MPSDTNSHTPTPPKPGNDQIVPLKEQWDRGVQVIVPTAPPPPSTPVRPPTQHDE